MKITTLFMFSALAALSFPTTSCVSEEVSNSIMLRSAARRNDWKKFCTLASAGAKMDPQEATKLLVRYAKGDISRAPDGLASALISAGADVNAGYSKGYSLLYFAAASRNWELFRVLASAGAKMSTQEAMELMKRYVRVGLSDASTDVVPVLVSMGMDVNALLYPAAARGNWGAFRVLVSAGAKVSVQEATEILVEITNRGRPDIPSDIASVLIAMGADVNAEKHNSSLLYFAAASRNWELFRVLESAGAKMSAPEATKLLEDYARRGKRSGISSDMVPMLVSMGADISAGAGGSRSLLYLAADGYIRRGCKDMEVYRALESAGAKMSVNEATDLLVSIYMSTGMGRISEDPSEMVTALISAGADVHAREWDGRSLLYATAVRKYWKIFGALVSSGVKMSAQDATKLLALYKTGRLSGAPSDMESVLISMGADVNAKDRDGRSLLYSAAALNDSVMFSALLSLGAKMSAREAQEIFEQYARGGHALIVELPGPGSIITPSSQGFSWPEPLFNGVAPGIVPILISMGADVNTRNLDNHSFLYSAADRRDYKRFSELASAGAKMSSEEATELLVRYTTRRLPRAPSDIVPILISMGADVNATDAGGRSLLAIAVDREDWELFSALSVGAKMDAKEATELLVRYVKGQLSGAPSGIASALILMGADFTVAGLDADDIRALMESEEKMTSQQRQGLSYSLLSAYIRGGQWQEIAEAVENKEIYLTDISPSSGQNAFHAVALCGWRSPDIDESFLVALKNAGVDVNKKDAEGFSPLATAIRVHNEKAVAALLKYGADPRGSIPVQKRNGSPGEKFLMDYALEIYKDSEKRLNETIRQRDNMPVPAEGADYKEEGQRGETGASNSAQQLLKEAFERRVREVNSQVANQQQEVEAAKTIVSLMARATGTEVSDM